MNVLNDMKIRTKLLGGSLITVALLVGIAVLGFLNMKKINDGTTSVYKDHLLPMQHLDQVEADFLWIRGDVYKFIMLPDERDSLEQAIGAMIDSANQYWGEFTNTLLDQKEKDEIPNFIAAWATYREVVAEVLAEARAGRAEAALAMVETSGKFTKSRLATSASLNKLRDINVALAEELNARGNKTFTGAAVAMVLLSALALILAVVIGVFLTRSIAGPINELSQVASRIASGDLSTGVSPAKRSDELGVMMQSFGRMVEGLRRMTTDLTEGVAQLGSSASEILAGTTQVASGTAEAAAAISETSTTVEEVRQAARLSSDKAKNVADNARRIAEVSQSGQKAVEETGAGMLNIKAQMGAVAQTITRLSEQSQLIGGITAAVTDLADQSNLLAVNAAIEAARAGEQGKGFAVVAQEIRSLAEQSKQATAQVRTVLSDVQKATSAAVIATEQGNKAVEAGVKQSALAGEAIRVLAESSAEAAQVAAQIVASSQQQTVGMDQIGTAMVNINQAGAQTAVSTRQAETAAQNLQQLGARLKLLAGQYRV
ncbi:MAG: methyl-accepting chemotaxis protein [candidate division WOR-3 bacterium]|nr:methyl-accepting chemotaxis protein [candidate division WOR-3 bacterium]